MISAATHIARLVRAGYVFAREGVFGVVDPSLVPPPGQLALKLARLIERPGAKSGPRLSRALTRLGRAVTGDAESYQYLVESIRKFPRPNAFAEMIRDAGFSRVKWESLSGGIVALHSGWRL